MYIQPVIFIVGQNTAEPPAPIEIVPITATEQAYIRNILGQKTWPKGFEIRYYIPRILKLQYEATIVINPKLAKEIRFVSGDPNKGGKEVGSFTREGCFFYFKVPYWQVRGLGGKQFNLLVTDLKDKKTLYKITIK
jgi:hypothetical protein